MYEDSGRLKYEFEHEWREKALARALRSARLNNASVAQATVGWLRSNKVGEFATVEANAEEGLYRMITTQDNASEITEVLDRW